MPLSQEIIDQTEKFAAHNYRPLPTVMVRGKGVWMFDAKGRRYLDMLSCYSALNFGHLHPRLVAALQRQLDKLTLTSRAVYTENLGRFSQMLAYFFDLDEVLPKNSGAEAVETAIKIARKWGYKVKKTPEGRAEIIVCENNFHGRTITVISFSSCEQYRDGFGPLTPGFKIIPFDDSPALERAITENTAAFLVEPIQGEGGINVPHPGYLKEAERVCREKNILFVLDEIQTGFGRTGEHFACHYEQVRPDLVVVGKALGGGLLPISAVVGKKDVMDVIGPGDDGSTFGGNPLACAVAIEAMRLLVEKDLSEQAQILGRYFMSELKKMSGPYVKEVRGKGLMVGMELVPEAGGARRFCEALLKEGVVCKDTCENVIRLSPPLIISRGQIDWALKKIKKVLSAPAPAGAKNPACGIYDCYD